MKIKSEIPTVCKIRIICSKEEFERDSICEVVSLGRSPYKE